jgi:site-specific recombinase XerD
VNWKTNKKCSDATIRSYRNDLKLFNEFLLEHSIIQITEVNHVVIGEYIRHMEQKQNRRSGKKGLSEASIARRLAAVSSYLEYIRAVENPLVRNPIRDLARRWQKNQTPKPIDETIIDRLLNGITCARDTVLIRLFLSTGLRVSELCQLNRDSITITAETSADGREHVIGAGDVVGKGGKPRAFFVDEETLQFYAEYLATRTDSHEALFLSERRQRISVRAVQYTLSTWCKRLGLPHQNPHRLRHSFATRMANANISSLVLQRLLGHSSFSTTANYFELKDSTLARGYFAAAEMLRR